MTHYSPGDLLPAPWHAALLCILTALAIAIFAAMAYTWLGVTLRHHAPDRRRLRVRMAAELSWGLIPLLIAAAAAAPSVRLSWRAGEAGTVHAGSGTMRAGAAAGHAASAAARGPARGGSMVPFGDVQRLP